MEKYTLEELPINVLMSALPHLVKGEVDETYIYNLIVNDDDTDRVAQNEYWLKIEKGDCTYGEGHLDDPESTLFTVKRGGLDTLIAFQVHGMKAAMNAMMLGYITASNIKKAEAWFRLLDIGEDELVEALKKAGYEITDTDMDIFEDLKLED